MLNTNRLKENAAAYGLQLSEEQLEQLDCYARLLAEWNQKINLTAITEPQAMEDRHFIDSLILAMQPEIGDDMVDVGSGAGFPGMVAKLYRPQLAVTLMEPTGKRIQFLNALAGELGVEVHTVKERAEEAARKTWREGFSTATARAVAALPTLCEYCLPLVRQGGHFLAMKAEAGDELKAAQSAIGKLGGALVDVRDYTLPDGSRRCIIVIEKEKATPPQYPRAGGVIAKRPL